ncbi:unnamed protein product, partial [Iphiclides podalirius]
MKQPNNSGNMFVTCAALSPVWRYSSGFTSVPLLHRARCASARLARKARTTRGRRCEGSARAPGARRITHEQRGAPAIHIYLRDSAADAAACRCTDGTRHTVCRAHETTAGSFTLISGLYRSILLGNMDSYRGPDGRTVTHTLDGYRIA